jgi:hypothetical protein
MSLETILERIAVALEARVTGAGIPTTDAPKAAAEPAKPAKARKAATPPPEPTPEPEGDEDDDFLGGDEEGAEKEYTVDDVREALVAYRTKFGAEPAKKLLKTAGKVDTLGALEAANYAAVVKAATAPKK